MRTQLEKNIFRMVIGMLAVIFLSLGNVSISFADPGPGEQSYSPEQEIQEAFEKTNKERVQYGLKPLTGNEKSAPAADVRAKEAAKVFSHTRPDGSSWYTADRIPFMVKILQEVIKPERQS